MKLWITNGETKVSCTKTLYTLLYIGISTKSSHEVYTHNVLSQCTK